MALQKNDPRSREVVATVSALVEPIVAERGLELVEVQFRRENIGWVLRIIIYRPGGVSVDDCAAVSREVSDVLDVEEMIEQAYHLEVSSPGLDRPLKNQKDFLRHLGEKVRITTKVPMDGERVVVGTIQAAEAGQVLLAAERGAVELPYAHIAKAKLVIEF